MIVGKQIPLLGAPNKKTCFVNISLTILYSLTFLISGGLAPENRRKSGIDSISMVKLQNSNGIDVVFVKTQSH